MKTFMKAIALCLCLLLCLNSIPAAFAAEAGDVTIDESRKGFLTIYNSGYSDCTVRVTYAATMNSDASVGYGDAGNPNDVVLTWKRSS